MAVPPREMRSSEARRLVIWDLPTRLFHWSLALLVLAAIVTSEDDRDLHALIGYAVLALVAFRIVWGFVGSQTARFTSFIHGPKAVIAYARGLFSREAEFHLGHNPLGGLVIVAMLGLLLVQGSLGLFSNDDILFEGPLAHLVSGSMQEEATDLHESIGNLIMFVVGIHIAAAFFYLVFKRTDLISPMFTGRRKVPAGNAVAEPKRANAWLALVIFGACAGLVYTIVA